MLLLKLLIVPLFLAGISLGSRRWGPHVGGLLAGFPVVTGPILVFLAVEQGPQFAALAAQGSLLAVVACVAFGIAFSHGGRCFAWPLSVLLGLLAWVGSAWALSAYSEDLTWAAGLAVLVIVLGPLLLPRTAVPEQPVTPLPAAELGARMFAGAALVFAVTALASALGTRWAGLMAMFPIMGMVLGLFSLRRSGPLFVARLFKGMFRGFYAFAAFCILVSLLLGSISTPIAFGAAVAAALVVQAGIYWATVPGRWESTTRDRVPSASNSAADTPPVAANVVESAHEAARSSD